MAEPLPAGGVHVTLTDRSPATALGAAGADGTVAGVTALDGADCGPVPTPLTAATRNV
jgi:hypothetical protein